VVPVNVFLKIKSKSICHQKEAYRYSIDCQRARTNHISGPCFPAWLILWATTKRILSTTDVKYDDVAGHAKVQEFSTVIAIMVMSHGNASFNIFR
jgi:hypothetical protein